MRDKKGKKFASETIGDETVDVYIEHDGRFHITYKDHELYSETLGGVLDAVKRKQRVKQTRVAIKATYLRTSRHSFGTLKPDLVDVEITGLHGRTNEILFRYVDTGNADRDRSYGSERFYRRMTQVEKDEFVNLDAEETKAQEKFAKWKKDREINAQRLITAEIKRIEEGEPAEATGDPRLDGKKKR